MDNLYQRFCFNRKRGYGLDLYRNVKKKSVAGVCGGIADHFEIDRGIVQIAFIAGFVFTGSFIFWFYAFCWVAMAPRKAEALSNTTCEYDEAERRFRKKKMFRYQRSSAERLRDANKRLEAILARVENMERYVTSTRFGLDKKFSEL